MIEKKTSNGADGQTLAITFVVGGSLFGMDTVRVQEVVRLGTITPVHHAVEYVAGVMNLRGHIATVIDLSARLGLGLSKLTPEKRIIIVEWSNERVGLIVDEMRDVLSVDPEAIGAAPENVRNVQSHQMKGVFRATDHIIAMLDLEKVLSVDETTETVSQGRETA